MSGQQERDEDTLERAQAAAAPLRDELNRRIDPFRRQLDECDEQEEQLSALSDQVNNQAEACEHEMLQQ